MLTASTSIPVSVDGVPYSVTLARSLDELGHALAAVLPTGRCVLVTNDVVGPIHAKAATAALAQAGWDPTTIVIADGEDRKDASTWLALVNALLDARVDRRTPVLALGGGVTGDMVGFAAASTQRGLPFVQVPTTLLAMVDASVGGKTGFNTAHGKNLVGAFWQPRLVYAPFSTLSTLPDAEIRCGLGEVVKHVLIAGESELAACEAMAPALLARDEAALAQVVAASVRTKAAIVEADPREVGVRATLNLGHTVAHAVESVAGYGALRHGEAVAIGLAAMCRYARSRGWMTDPALCDRVERLLIGLGLPTTAPDSMSVAALAAAALFDKKRSRATVTIAVPVAPGQVELRPLPVHEVQDLVRFVRP